MSYILEALKKAQAERQLGETPTIHAPALDTQAIKRGTPLSRPLVAALVALGIVSVGLAGLLWRQMTASPAASAPASVAATVPATAPAVAPTVAPAVARAAPPATVAAPAPAPVVAVPAATVAEPAKPVAAPPAPVASATPAPEPKRPEPAAEEPVQALRDLPEPIQRAIPPIAMSGYMYSSNPADRLILIDKVLRHEGDEVAPGLVLVRLEPKGAVFAFRGYRYRIPY